MTAWVKLRPHGSATARPVYRQQRTWSVTADAVVELRVIAAAHGVTINTMQRIAHAQ
jgi:hypothetical protein